MKNFISTLSKEKNNIILFQKKALFSLTVKNLNKENKVKMAYSYQFSFLRNKLLPLQKVLYIYNNKKYFLLPLTERENNEVNYIEFLKNQNKH
tara:strand:+ start:143 stop:421 length:279 start_codon:yes stop_codon:yes gene_type:complete